MSSEEQFVPMKLGINGLGRIGKLALWDHVDRRFFSEVVVNIGRDVGGSLADAVHFMEKDSTYGNLEQYLHGCRGGRVIEDLSEEEGTVRMNGVLVRVLRRHRNPAAIGWRDLGVELVVDATGAFLDPAAPADDPKGSARGHLEAGARKVIVSAPFKIKDKSKEMPPDAVTTIMGINDADFDPTRHLLVSNASCTTTWLAYMIKPLLDYFGPQRILSASMTTVHAATSSQQVLDRAPKAKAADLRKSRSAFNNIILTTTGAAKALGLVIPEMKQIGFIAESVRVPVTTGSLIILVVLVQDESMRNPVNRARINGIYQEATRLYPKDYLRYSEEQNVSSDIIGFPRAAAIIEGHETHTRTAAVRFDTSRFMKSAEGLTSDLEDPIMEIPVTQAVIYGWYDNELGSYTHMLGDRTVSIAKLLQ